ncbi:MAG: hypothetical protein V4580_01520 [Bacteroidota bacterium]
MYKIDLHNYEAYLLDFSEGNLSDEGQMELELFLIQHPELEINLDELSFTPLEDETITFSDKTPLKRSPLDLVSESQFIAYVENQLTAKERLELEKSCVTNPSLLKDLALYNSTIATADTSVVFENKESLKRRPKVIWFNFSTTQYAAAACVVFLIGLFMLWPKTEVGTTSTLANNTNNEKTDTLPYVNISNAQNSTEVLTVPDESIHSLAQNHSANTAQQQQALTNNSTTLQPANKVTMPQDSIIAPNNSPAVQSPKNDLLMAQNTAPVVKQPTVVQVISENDEELLASNEPAKKKGIWAAASRALKNLNHVGVKGVNGDEETNKENTAYALTLGGVSITHKAGKL